jgi:ABC-type polar amino acid transport system ATPase subunit
MTTGDALVVRGLRVARPDRVVLDSVDLDVAPGQVRALMGESGTGKTTVLRAIVALQPFDEGSITIGEAALRPGPVPPESRLRTLRRRVGIVFQAPSLFEHLTAGENVTLAPTHALGWTTTRAEEVAQRLFTTLGVATRASALPRQLSGGEAQRVAIARALAPDPGMLLLDEPTSALDPARRGALGETLRELARQGRGLLIATHDVEFAQSFADRVSVLSDGRIVEEGAARHVLSAPAHPATREFLRHQSE